MKPIKKWNLKEWGAVVFVILLGAYAFMELAIIIGMVIRWLFW